MSTASHTENDTVKEWRERLPKVPLAVPEEEDPYRLALPRAVVTGAALAVLGGAALTALSVLFQALNRYFSGEWSGREVSELSDAVALLGLVVSVPVKVAVMLVAFLWIAGRIGATYGRITYSQANNRAATWIGIVLAGTGTALAERLFKVIVTNHGLLPPSHTTGIVKVIFFFGSILALQLIVLAAWQSSLRRRCPRCGGLFIPGRRLSTSTSAAEQLVAAQNATPVNLPAIEEEYPDGNPDGADVSLWLYRCEGCSARLLEGHITLELPERKENWDVTWRWLSGVYSPEETAALEASFPRPAFWERLL